MGPGIPLDPIRTGKTFYRWRCRLPRDSPMARAVLAHSPGPAVMKNSRTRPSLMLPNPALSLKHTLGIAHSLCPIDLWMKWINHFLEFKTGVTFWALVTCGRGTELGHSKTSNQRRRSSVDSTTHSRGRKPRAQSSIQKTLSDLGLAAG